MITYPRVISYLERNEYHGCKPPGVDDLLEQLDDALAGEGGESRLYRLIEELALRAQQELLEEEETMKRASYPPLEFHCAKHRFFVNEIARLKTLCSSKHTQFFKRIVRFLRNWLRYHRHNDDSTFSNFMANSLQPAVSLCGS